MQTVEKRRRRRHAPAFKAAAVAACPKPGASVAAVALDLQINANMLRAWIKRSTAAPTIPTAVTTTQPVSTAGFLPLKLESPAATTSKPTSTAPSPERSIRVHIRKGGSRITIEWPVAAAGSCAVWLRELLG